MDTWLPWKCVHGMNEPFTDCEKCSFLSRHSDEDEHFSRLLEEIKKSLPANTVEASLTAVKDLVRRMESTPGYMDYKIYRAYAGACALRNELMTKHRAEVLSEAAKLLNTSKPFDERLSDFHAAAEGFLPVMPGDACCAVYRHLQRIIDAADFPDLLAWYTHDKGVIIPDEPAFWTRLEAARAVVVAEALAAGMELSTDPNEWTTGLLPTPYQQAKGWLRCQAAIAANEHVWV